MSEMITKTEFQDHCKSNDDRFDRIEDIVSPLQELYPALKESVELKKATDQILNKYKKGAKTLSIFLVVIATLITIIISIRHFVIDLMTGTR